VYEDWRCTRMVGVELDNDWNCGAGWCHELTCLQKALLLKKYPNVDDVCIAVVPSLLPHAT